MISHFHMPGKGQRFIYFAPCAAARLTRAMRFCRAAPFIGGSRRHGRLRERAAFLGQQPPTRHAMPGVAKSGTIALSMITATGIDD